MSFNEMLKKLKEENYDMVIVAYENEENRTIKDAIRGKELKNIAVVIGPEGGLDSTEIAGLKALDSEIVSLGKTILRTETAGPIAISMIMYEMEL